MKVEGNVHRIQCRSCGAFGCAFTFVGDTDMSTDGLMDFTEGRDDEIYTAALAGTFLVDGAVDYAKAETAADALFSRTSLRMSRIVEWVRSGSRATGSFRDFKEHYRQDRPIYACPSCREGRASEQARVPHRKFLENGGVIHLAPGLELT